jgi:hypothetical protein
MMKVVERRSVMMKRIKRRLFALLLLAGMGLLFSKRHRPQPMPFEDRELEPPTIVPTA